MTEAQRHRFALDTWRIIRRISLDEIYGLYKRMNVKLGPEDTRGESFYAGMCPRVVSDLKGRDMG